MNKTLLVTAVSGLLCGNAYCELVGYWSGDGNPNDLAFGNDGVLVDGAGYGPGVFGEAFLFDGVSSRVEIPTDSLYDFGTGDFSVSFWVNFDVLANNDSGIISKDSYAGGGNYNGWLFNRGDALGGVGMEVRNVPAVDTQTRTSVGNFTTGEWYHIAGVREANVDYLYVDGVLKATSAEGTPADVTNSDPLRIGTLTPASFQAMDGSVDEVRLYNHALSVSEVQALAVPEPTALALVLGAGFLSSFRRKRKAATA